MEKPKHLHELGAIVCNHVMREDQPLIWAHRDTPNFGGDEPGQLCDSGWSFGCDKPGLDHTVDDLSLVCLNCWVKRLEQIEPGFWAYWNHRTPEGHVVERDTADEQFQLRKSTGSD